MFSKVLKVILFFILKVINYYFKIWWRETFKFKYLTVLNKITTHIYFKQKKMEEKKGIDDPFDIILFGHLFSKQKKMEESAQNKEINTKSKF